jgi:hypothetical protein
MTTNYTLTIDDAYVTPEGEMTKAQYVNFVMNMAAQSYQTMYSVVNKEDGIQDACDAYNAALPASAEE